MPCFLTATVCAEHAVIRLLTHRGEGVPGTGTVYYAGTKHQALPSGDSISLLIVMCLKKLFIFTKTLFVFCVPPVSGPAKLCSK